MSELVQDLCKILKKRGVISNPREVLRNAAKEYRRCESTNDGMPCGLRRGHTGRHTALMATSDLGREGWPEA